MDFRNERAILIFHRYEELPDHSEGLVLSGQTHDPSVAGIVIRKQNKVELIPDASGNDFPT